MNNTDREILVEPAMGSAIATAVILAVSSPREPLDIDAAMRRAEARRIRPRVFSGLGSGAPRAAKQRNRGEQGADRRDLEEEGVGMKPGFPSMTPGADDSDGRDTRVLLVPEVIKM